MMHIPDDRLLSLAEKILRKRELSYREVLDIKHISECDHCYELLQCVMAVTQVTDHMELAFPKSASKIAAPAASTIIQITILDSKAILKQLQTQASTWNFSEALDLAALRSSGTLASSMVVLEDIEDSGSSIVYDPVRRVLAVSLTLAPGQAIPRAFLRFADGREQPLEFQQEEDACFARVEDMPSGEYQFILEP